MKKLFTAALATVALSACGKPTLEEQVQLALDDTLKEYETLFSKEEVCITAFAASSNKLETLARQLETDTDGHPPENIQKKLLEFENKTERLMKNNIQKLNPNC